MRDGRLLAVGGSSRKEQIPALEYVEISTVSSPPKPSHSGTESWPQWRGKNRDGVATATAWRKDWPQAGLPVLWRTAIGAGMSSPVVAKGRIILHGNDGKGSDHIVALDAVNGTELWRRSIPCKSEPHEMPIVPAGPGATPTIAGDSVFALTREGQFACLNFATGEIVWQKNLVTDLGGKRPVYGYTQSPLVTGGRVILDIGCEPEKTGSTAALDTTTGAVIWCAGTGEAGYSSAREFMHAGKKCVAIFKGESLQLLDFTDGRTISSHRTTARDFSNAATPTFIQGGILVSNTGTEPAALLAIDDSEEMKARWTHKQFALLFNSPIVHDGAVFAFNEKRRGHHEFTCLDAASGSTRWVSDAIATSTFILADEHWIFLTRDGELALAPATTAELKIAAKFKAAEGKFYATPAIADGRIFIRSNSGEVLVFDARKP
jgi:outer membrane protein assembly factor BamB